MEALCYRDGILKFNRTPDDGVDHLIRNNVFGSANSDKLPEEVALFLFSKTNVLDPHKVGAYITDRGAFNGRVLDEYLKLFPFEHNSLDVALRLVLSRVAVPLHPHSIQHLLTVFATQYHSRNVFMGQLFRSVTQINVLCLVLLRVNHTCHAVHSRDLYDGERMLYFYKHRVNWALNNNSYDHLILDMFDRVRGTKIELVNNYDQQNIPFQNPTCSGWLHKHNKHGHHFGQAWKKRWFLLADQVLYYFDDSSLNKLRCVIPLSNCSVSYGDRQFSFKIVPPHKSASIRTVKFQGGGTGSGTNAMNLREHSQILLQASNQQDFYAWSQAFISEMGVVRPSKPGNQQSTDVFNRVLRKPKPPASAPVSKDLAAGPANSTMPHALPPPQRRGHMDKADFEAWVHYGCQDKPKSFQQVYAVVHMRNARFNDSVLLDHRRGEHCGELSAYGSSFRTVGPRMYLFNDENNAKMMRETGDGAFAMQVLELGMVREVTVSNWKRIQELGWFGVQVQSMEVGSVIFATESPTLYTTLFRLLSKLLQETTSAATPLPSSMLLT